MYSKRKQRRHGNTVVKGFGGRGDPRTVKENVHGAHCSDAMAGMHQGQVEDVKWCRHGERALEAGLRTPMSGYSRAIHAQSTSHHKTETRMTIVQESEDDKTESIKFT